MGLLDFVRDDNLKDDSIVRPFTIAPFLGEPIEERRFIAGMRGQ
jgi:hypothetical protein